MAGEKERSGGGNLLSARKEFSILSKAPCEHKFRAAAVANNKQQAANSKRQTATKGHSQYVKSSIRSPLFPSGNPFFEGGSDTREEIEIAALPIVGGRVQLLQANYKTILQLFPKPPMKPLHPILLCIPVRSFWHCYYFS